MSQPRQPYFSIVLIGRNIKALTCQRIIPEKGQSPIYLDARQRSLRQRWRWTGVYLCLGSLFLSLCFWSGCSSTKPLENAPSTEPPLPVWTPPSARAEQSMVELIRLEREAAHEGNLALLAELWVLDGRVVDGRGTSTPADDYIWQGRAAILDRYRVAVAPNPPPLLTDVEEQEYHFQIEQDTAIAHNSQDQWRFLYANGRWWLTELVYNQ